MKLKTTHLISETTYKNRECGCHGVSLFVVLVHVLLKDCQKHSETILVCAEYFKSGLL